MSFNRFKKKAAEATANARDMREADSAPRSEPPAEGATRLRFVGYVELGDQVETYQNIPRIRPKVALTFELSGKRHPPVTLDDGTVVPRRIKIELTQSLSERATLFQLFRTMNHTGNASHISQLLGDPFIGRVYHHTFTDSRGEERTIARLKPRGGTYSIQPPFYEDEDGETREYRVDEPLSEGMLFFWDTPDLEMWDSLYIEGTWSDGRSRNVVQEQIRRAVNWEGSPMYQLLVEDGRDPETFAPLEPLVKMGEAEETPAPKSAPKPAAKPKPAPKPQPKPSPELEDEDDDDEEDAPPPRPTKPASKPASKPAPKPAPEPEDEDEDDEGDADPRMARVASLIADM